MISRQIKEDETTVTEITIQPDGRIYLFGASPAILELMAGLAPTDEGLRQILSRLADAKAQVSDTSVVAPAKEAL